MQNDRERFVALFDKLGPLSGKDVLKCIEFAKIAMLKGECGVEAYYFAKNVLLTEVEAASPFIN